MGHPIAGSGGGIGAFQTTQWTIVCAAAEATTPEARQALAVLCERYWLPIYVYVRRRGFSSHQAEDLTQAFFGDLLENTATLCRADPGRGKFRSFLLGVLRRFLGNELDRMSAIRRGGRARVIPLDLDGAEERLSLAVSPTYAPERAFEREWGLAVLRQAFERLRARCAREGKGELFGHFQPHLSGDEDRAPLRELAGRLGMNEGAVKVALHRMRKEYGQCVREEVAETLGSASELDEEIQHLFRALQS